MEENEKRDINMVAMEVIMNAGAATRSTKHWPLWPRASWTRWTSCWKRQKL